MAWKQPSLEWRDSLKRAEITRRFFSMLDAPRQKSPTFSPRVRPSSAPIPINFELVMCWVWAIERGLSCGLK